MNEPLLSGSSSSGGVLNRRNTASRPAEEAPSSGPRERHPSQGEYDIDDFDEELDLGQCFLSVPCGPRRTWRWLRRRATLAEFSGSVGDLGSFLPVIATLASNGQIYLPSVLIWAGAFNIFTGLIFYVPMCVQPMTAISLAAISDNLSQQEILAAGIWVGVMILFLGEIRLLGERSLIPMACVRGIQIALGISVAQKGLKMAWEDKDWFGWDSRLTSVAVAVLVVLTARFNRFPTALVIFILGAIIAIIVEPSAFTQLRPTVAYPRYVDIPVKDFFWRSLTVAALPQLPLTSLNSVVATVRLSHDLFPKRRAHIPVVRVTRSLGVFNVIASLFGALPSCHGAGGLAAQYRFGARSNLSIIFLGTMKLLAGVFLGTSILGLLHVYPKSILGMMLAFSGVEVLVSSVDGSVLDREYGLVTFCTAAASLYFETGYGFLVGLVITALHLGVVPVLQAIAEGRSLFGNAANGAPPTMEGVAEEGAEEDGLVVRDVDNADEARGSARAILLPKLH